MDEQQFEKRLEFLKKAYDRVPSQDVSEEVVKIIANEQKEKERKNKNNIKSTWWKNRVSVLTASIASIAIITFLLVSQMSDVAPADQASGSSEGTSEEVDDHSSNIEYSAPITSVDDPKETSSLVEKVRVKWPNEDAIQSTHQYLKNMQDIEQLKKATPTEIVILAEYAARINAPEILYNTFLNSSIPKSKQHFIDEWEGGKIIPDNTDVIVADVPNEVAESRSEGKYSLLVQLLEDERVIKTILLQKDEQGVWRIDYDDMLVTKSVYFERTFFISGNYVQSVKSLYEQFSKSKDSSLLLNQKASMIANLYLEAGVSGDYETQYALLAKEGDSFYPEKNEFIQPVGDASTLDWKTDFQYFYVQEQPFQQRGQKKSLVVWYGLNNPTADEDQKGFQMIETSEGWRVSYMPFQ